MNGCDCVPIKDYSQEQAMSWIWPTDHSFPIHVLDFFLYFHVNFKIRFSSFRKTPVRITIVIASDRSIDHFGKN